MECEQSYFTFCTLFPLAIGIFSFIKLDTLIDVAINGVGVGKLRKNKQHLTVNTPEGYVRLPTVKMPTIDWEVYFIDDETDLKDGFHNLSLIDNLSKTICKQHRDLLLCEYLYPKDYSCKEDVKMAISSPLDDYCYVFTVKGSDPIDYTSRLQTFLNEIEEN